MPFYQNVNPVLVGLPASIAGPEGTIDLHLARSTFASVAHPNFDDFKFLDRPAKYHASNLGDFRSSHELNTVITNFNPNSWHFMESLSSFVLAKLTDQGLGRESISSFSSIFHGRSRFPAASPAWRARLGGSIDGDVFSARNPPIQPGSPLFRIGHRARGGTVRTSPGDLHALLKVCAASEVADIDINRREMSARLLNVYLEPTKRFACYSFLAYTRTTSSSESLPPPYTLVPADRPMELVHHWYRIAGTIAPPENADSPAYSVVDSFGLINFHINAVAGATGLVAASCGTLFQNVKTILGKPVTRPTYLQAHTSTSPMLSGIGVDGWVMHPGAVPVLSNIQAQMSSPAFLSLCREARPIFCTPDIQEGQGAYRVIPSRNPIRDFTSMYNDFLRQSKMHLERLSTTLAQERLKEEVESIGRVEVMKKYRGDMSDLLSPFVTQSVRA